MYQLRQAAARERRVPIYWWLFVMAATGGVLVFMVWSYSRLAALFLGCALVVAWAVPLVAMQSLSAPPRAKKLPPEPGEGTYDDWMEQALLLGRMLLYFGDNPNLSPDVHRALRAARADLRDTLQAHPLRDDLERVCRRVREGAIRSMKDWFSREYRHDIRELANDYEQTAAAEMDADTRLLALQHAVEKAAAMMSRNCMPRMLERQRLACAVDCAWLAVQAAVERPGQVSPVDLAEMLVIEWSDFSEPWQPARALRLALERLARPDAASPAPVPDEANGRVVIRNGKRYRRVRVRHKHRRHARRLRGPSLVDVFLSFGQWVRYSIRAWMLYR